MKDTEVLNEVMSSLHTGDKIPAIDIVNSNPMLASIISKFSAALDPEKIDLDNNKSYYSLNQSKIQAISESIKTRNKDNENILQLFPDIELAIQILVSSILSPKDMMSIVLNYKNTEPIVSASLTGKLMDIISTSLEDDYKIKDDLPTILTDALFSTGSYVKAVIPESIVDKVINNRHRISTEDFKNSADALFNDKAEIVNLGFLGNTNSTKKSVSLENFGELTKETNYDSKVRVAINDSKLPDKKTSDALLVEVVDNFDLLKLPDLLEYKRSIVSSMLISNEGRKYTKTSLNELLFARPNGKQSNFIALPKASSAKRKSVGKPLVIRLPSESVIPIYIPGDETKHIGYFVLIDAEGNPVTEDSNRTYMDGLSNLGTIGNGAGDTLSGILLERAKKNIQGIQSFGDIKLENMTKIYSSIIEQDLTERLQNGIYGKNVKISDSQEIYRVMLARSLASQHTRLLFVPSDLVTYFAFKYFNNGVGKSYLDNIKLLTSLRAVMLFSKIMAMVKSAISITKVNMTIDPRDPDPRKTVETAIHDIVKMRQMYFPVGVTSPSDLVDWLNRAGLEFTFEGHPGLPDTKFEFETSNMQRDVPDEALDEALRKQTYMSIGLSPETVDSGMNAEFATTVVANNILFSKRVYMLGNMFSNQLTDYAKKLILYNEDVMTQLKTIVSENEETLMKNKSQEDKEFYNNNKEEYISNLVIDFVNSIKVELPKPDTTSITNQSAAYDEYIEALDKVIQHWVSSELISSDINGEISNNMDSIRNNIKSYFIRKWCMENGYMIELEELVTSDDEDKPILDLYHSLEDHSKALLKNGLKYINKMLPTKLKTDKELEKMGTEAGETDDGLSDNTSSSDTNDTSSDDGLGDMSFNLEEPPEEEAPEEDTSKLEEETSETSSKTNEDGTVEESSSSTSTKTES